MFSFFMLAPFNSTSIRSHSIVFFSSFSNLVFLFATLLFSLFSFLSSDFVNLTVWSVIRVKIILMCYGRIFTFVKKLQMEKSDIQAHIYSLVIPKEILVSFEIENIKENEEIVEIELIEKELIPPELAGKLAVLNGYMNTMELQSYPIQGRKCYLKLKRRRWKVQGTTDSTNCHNVYDFAAEGTKATKMFGAFLKENGF